MTTKAASSRRPPLPACSIASHNYLAMAQVLATSYAEHHPGAEVYVCIVDRRDPEIDYDVLPFRCVFADELGIPEFLNFAFRYDILELNTAVKPYLLAHLRDKYGHEAAFYFDPDIWILDRLDGLAGRLDAHPLLLTPHVTAPLSDDHDPAERKILQVGVYNLGFLGLRLDESTRDFLTWWQDRLRRFCLADPPHGLFVDQLWASFAPAFVDNVAVVREPIYNVAYWNLPHRHPTFEDGAWRVRGEKVGFFHFSGVQFDDLTTVSKHQDRLAPGARPELRPLFEAYRDQVRSAGQERWRRHAYSYGRFRGGAGAPIPPVARRTLQRVDPWGRRWRDPFDGTAADSYLSWLIEAIAVPTGRVNRAVLALWEQRDDLLRSFPDVQGLDLHGYLDWLSEEREAGRPPLPEIFLEGLRSGVPRRVARVLGHRGTGPSAPSSTPATYRVHRQAGEVWQALHPNHAGSLAAWLNDPIPGRRATRPVITRLMMLLYDLREDLRRDYPDPLGDDQRSFAYWFCREGAAEFDVAREFVDPVLRSLTWKSRLSLLRQRLANRGREPAAPVPAAPVPAAPVPAAPEPAVEQETPLESQTGKELETPAPPRRNGVQIVGCFGELSSLEERANSTAAALRAAGDDEASQVVEIALDQNVWGKSSGGRVHSPDGAPFDVSVLQIPPFRTREALSVLPAAVLAGGRVVGYWWWDLAHLHLGMVSDIAHLDEIWVPSRFALKAVGPLATVPVRVVTPHVARPDGEAADRGLHGTEAQAPNAVVFYNSFDAGDVAERANPFGLLDLWFRLAREPRPDGPVPVLSLRIERAARDPELVAAVHQRIKHSGPLPIHVHDDPAVPESALLAASDVWISLDRGSALGVRTVRAMRLGKPAIASAYGGAVDYLDATGSYPVRCGLRRLERHEGPFPSGAVWGDPDPEDAMEQVRQVLRSPDLAAERARRGQDRVEALYGSEAAGKGLISALRELRIRSER